MNNTEELEKLKKLQKSMAKRLKGWGIKNSASLGDLAGATESWSSEVKTLSYYKSLHCKSFQRAKAHLQKAWDNRDSREKALKELTDAYNAISEVEAEITSPTKSSHMEKHSAKSLYGEEIGRNAYQPDEFSDLYTLKRYIVGFMATKSEIDVLIIKDVAEDFIAFAEQYPRDNVLNQYAMKIVQGLDRIAKGGYNQTFVRKTLNDISDTIDDMALIAEKKLSPSGYKAFMGIDGKDSLENTMKRLDSVVNARTFMSPSQFATKTIHCIDSIEEKMAQYYDPKITRLTRNIRLQIQNVHKLSNMSTKSLDMDEINKRCDIALNDISELQTHISNIN